MDGRIREAERQHCFRLRVIWVNDSSNETEPGELDTFWPQGRTPCTIEMTSRGVSGPAGTGAPTQGKHWWKDKVVCSAHEPEQLVMVLGDGSGAGGLHRGKRGDLPRATSPLSVVPLRSREATPAAFSLAGCQPPFSQGEGCWGNRLIHCFHSVLLGSVGGQITRQPRKLTLRLSM